MNRRKIAGLLVEQTFNSPVFLKIPLLDGKGTDTFNPDFIVWTENEILALDTKGSHLIAEDSNRKLFYIEKACEGKELIIKLVSEKSIMNVKK